MPKVDVSKLTVEELLRCFADVMDELKARNVVRTRNNPVGGYAERLVSRRLGLTLAPGNMRGYDALDLKEKRYQIKARRIYGTNQSRELGAIRNIKGEEFDYLIAVLFNRDFAVTEAYRIPHAAIAPHASKNKRTGAYRLHVQGKVLRARGVQDITKRLQGD